MSEIRRGRPVTLSTSGTEQIAITTIRRDGGTQPRAGLDDAHVERIVEALSEGHDVPAVTLYFDGSDYWLADGFHRVEATIRHAGEGSDISAEIRQGSRRDAVLHSVGANRGHGLPRTREDTRRGIETLLRDEEWGQWSDREIARQVGCSDKTVGAARTRLGAEIPHLTERKAPDGKAYPATQPARPAKLCTSCGLSSSNGIWFGTLCEGCYHLDLARTRPGDHAAWNLQKAREYHRDNPAMLAVIDNGSHRVQLPRCFDCGTTEQVEAVGGAVKYLCRSCSIRRGQVTYDLSHDALVRGWSYGLSAAQIQVKQSGVFRQWIYCAEGEKVGSPQHIARAVAWIEAAVAAELAPAALPAPNATSAPAVLPAEPQGGLEAVHAAPLVLPDLPPGWAWQAGYHGLIMAVRQANGIQSGWYRIKDELHAAVAWVEMRKNDEITWGHRPGYSAAQRLAQLAGSDDPRAETARAVIYLSDPEVRPAVDQVSAYEMEQMCKYAGCRLLAYGLGWKVITPDGKKHWFDNGREGEIIDLVTAIYQQRDAAVPAPSADEPAAADEADEGDEDDPPMVPDARPAYADAAQRLVAEIAAMNPSLQRLLLAAISAYEDVGLMRADGVEGLIDVLTTGLIMCDDETLEWANTSA
jgi:hypothetical protein